MENDNLPENVRDLLDNYASTQNYFNKNRIMNRVDRIVKLAQRDGWICQLCKEPITAKTATIDHKIPRRQGGSSAMVNLQLAHMNCNRIAGQKATTKRGYCERCDSPLDVLKGRLCQSCREQTRNRGREQSEGSLFIDKIISRALSPVTPKTLEPEQPREMRVYTPRVYEAPVASKISDFCEEAVNEHPEYHKLCVMTGCACHCHKEG